MKEIANYLKSFIEIEEMDFYEFSKDSYYTPSSVEDFLNSYKNFLSDLTNHFNKNIFKDISYTYNIDKSVLCLDLIKEKINEKPEFFEFLYLFIFSNIKLQMYDIIKNKLSSECAG